ncbi:hypothetical protein B0O99DRAFT_513688, partial [Bisporella sp. PMI_857]
WREHQYIVATDTSLIPIRALHATFASPEFYWANPLPDLVLQETLENSLCFGLYKVSQHDVVGEKNLETDVITTSSSQIPSTIEGLNLTWIGIARCVTDYTTFLYLTDVWVDPTYQGKGLGKWLIKCVQEVIENMPYLRRSILFTADWDRSVPFYEKLMDMAVVESQKGKGLAVMERKGRGHPSFGGEGSGYQ